MKAPPTPLHAKRSFLGNPAFLAAWISTMLLVAACGGSDEEEARPPEKRQVEPETIVPVVRIEGPQSAPEDALVTLQASAGGYPAGTNLRYAWTQHHGDHRVTLTGGDTSQLTFTAPDVREQTELTFTVTITDDERHTGTATATVTISPLDDGGYRAGVFEPWSDFADLCENPRSGVDADGDPYPDMPGSAVDEKNFLRSWSNDTYLWYNEIEDIDPNDESYSTARYFHAMRTREKLPSGIDKDRSHYTRSTADTAALYSTGALVGYGAVWATVGGEAVVSYVQTGSPAHRHGLSRGARVLALDGDSSVSFAALNSTRLGEEHAFTVRDLGAKQARTFTMRTEEIRIDPVQHETIIETDTGAVGYVFFTRHIGTAEQQFIEAFGRFAEQAITDLVLDMRYNTGGLLVVANEVAAMIASPAASSGRVFYRQRFNDKHPRINPVTGNAIDPGHFRTTAYGFSARKDTPLPTLNLTRVFVLTSSRTCSASEAIINGLRGIGVQVVLVGTTTCGKPYGFYATDNCGTSYYSIQFKGENDAGFGDYAQGFGATDGGDAHAVRLPGCTVSGDDFDHALGDANEARLAAALQYRTDGTCPSKEPVGAAAAIFGEAPELGMMLQ